MTNHTPQLVLYNMIGSDGSWFSPFGWRSRAVALAKQVDVRWVGVRPSEMAATLAFAGTRSAPVLVDEAAPGGPAIVLDSMAIARTLEAMAPQPAFFRPEAEAGIALFDSLITATWQIPGLAAFGPDYFRNGVISGEDVPYFRTIIERASGRSVEENLAIQPQLMADFRSRLKPLDQLLGAQDFVLRDLSHADALLYSCLKCFATVRRGVAHAIGPREAMPNLHAWYHRFEEVCHIEDPW